MWYDLTLKVNGKHYSVRVTAGDLLVDVLREQIGFTGVKKGCDVGVCGACTITLDGKAVKSCLTLALQARGKEVLTIEGLARDGHLHPIQQSFIDHAAVQCGFCTPGMIMSAKALLDEKPNPTEDDVKVAISGNLCRCTGYLAIKRAILSAAGQPGQASK